MPGERQGVGMEGPPTVMLTEAQLACVRLVHKGPSKVIAKELGISHHTVDDHLRQAMRRLGVGTRHEAAARVAAWDAGHPQVLMPQPETVANPSDPAMISLPSAIAGAPVHVQHNTVREERARYSAQSLEAAGLGRLTRYWLGSLIDDLTGPNRVRGTLILALILSVIVLVLVGIGNALQVSLQTYAGH